MCCIVVTIRFTGGVLVLGLLCLLHLDLGRCSTLDHFDFAMRFHFKRLAFTLKPLDEEGSNEPFLTPLRRLLLEYWPLADR